MSRTPENLVEKASTATKEVAQALFNTRIGRFFLASATLLSATAMVAENITSADEAAKSCLDLRYNPNVLVRGTSFEDSSSVKFEVLVSEACRVNPDNPNARLVKVEALIMSPWVNQKEKRSTGDKYSYTPVNLSDDGTNGDLVAGDNKYTAELYFDSTVPLEVEGIKGLSAQTPFPSSGITMTYTDNAKKTNDQSPDLYVVDRSIIPPDFKVDQRGNGIQVSEHVINIRDDAVNVSRLLTHSLEDSGAVLANRVYKEVAGGSDPWQFLQFSSDNRSLAINELTYEELGMPIRRDFAGIGGAGSSGSGTEIAEQYGSKGNLRMMIFTANPVKLYAWLNGFTHWGAGLNLPASLGLTDQSVWKGKMLPGGLLGGIPVQDLGDGTFKSLGGVRSVPKMNPQEKYLFGLIPKEQVPPAYIGSRESNCFGKDCIISKFDKKVTIDDIIASLGGVVRSPGPSDPNLLKDFKAGHIYTTTGRMATREEMFVQDIITKQRAEAWKNATDGLSTMQFVVPEAGIGQVEAPQIIEPYAGRTSNDLSVKLQIAPKQGIKWVQYQVIPFANDGPGVNMVIGDPTQVAEGMFKVPAPKLGEGPYIMLPGQSYTERARVSKQALMPDTNKDTGWSPWSTDTVKTPEPPPDAVRLIEPGSGITIQSLTPTLRWTSAPGIFYNEIRVSTDPTFDTNPATATAAVYWNFINGGETTPLNSWQAPAGALAPNTRYYAQARARVQGDGTPVAWSATTLFTTSINASIQGRSILGESSNVNPSLDAVSAECTPTVGLQPQIVGNIPDLTFPPDCYTLQSGAGPLNNSSVSLAPVRW